MRFIKKEMEKRGYDVEIFKEKGMGGREYEEVEEKKGFVEVLDLWIKEVKNEERGYVVK